MTMVMVIAFFLSPAAEAGCPARGAQDVVGKIRSCNDVKAIDGSIVEFDIIEVLGLNVGMDLKTGQKLKVFVRAEEGLICKGFPKKTSLCVNVQMWCPMAGKEPHGIAQTGYHVRRGGCEAKSIKVPE